MNSDALLVERTHRALAQVWIDFESALLRVPIIERLVDRRLRIDDYRLLLFNLRQQVVEGSRWISRASSSLSPANEELRSLFVRHAAAEHRDFRLLEQDYVASGGVLEDIQSGQKNIGSEALSAFMYQAASKPDPLGLLGAMFIIEGLGNRMAGSWAASIREQLELPEDAVRFLSYHGENDAEHLDMFDDAVRLALTGGNAEAVSADIVRHAKIVARLYRLQLEELDRV